MSRARLLSLLAAGCLVLGAAIAVAPAAASSPPGPVFRHALHSGHVRSFWTKARIQAAKPLPLVHLTRAAPAVSARASSSSRSRSASSARPSYVPAAAPRASARVNGIDTGKPSKYPNRANGVVLGRFLIDGHQQQYRCSGSVINTPAGNVVLTAGHCVIDPDTGAIATDLVFVPGYRTGKEPYGEWNVNSFLTTARWQATAGTAKADEAGDIAMLVLGPRPSDGAEVQSIVGALGIGFNQPRRQIYTEYGYPAEKPYNGSRLYRVTSGYQFGDPSFSPQTMAIHSDFTGGSSGGPWVIGGRPVAVSVTDYSYLSSRALKGYMFGPHFDGVAHQLYRDAGGAGPGSKATGEISGGVPKTSNRFTITGTTLQRGRGTATMSIEIPEAGRMVLSGDGIRRLSQRFPGGGTLKLPIVPRGLWLSQLRSRGSTRVRIRLAYSPTGGNTRVKSRGVTLQLR